MDWERMKMGFGVTVVSSVGLQWVQAVWVGWLSLIERENGAEATIHFLIYKKIPLISFNSLNICTIHKAYSSNQNNIAIFIGLPP